MIYVCRLIDDFCENWLGRNKEFFFEVLYVQSCDFNVTLGQWEVKNSLMVHVIINMHAKYCF